MHHLITKLFNPRVQSRNFNMQSVDVQDIFSETFTRVKVQVYNFQLLLLFSELLFHWLGAFFQLRQLGFFLRYLRVENVLTFHLVEERPTVWQLKKPQSLANRLASCQEVGPVIFLDALQLASALLASSGLCLGSSLFRHSILVSRQRPRNLFRRCDCK